jgi:hypothetical protein
MSEEIVTIRYTGRGPNLHRRVSPEELSEYDFESGPWEIKDKDAFVKESDETDELAREAARAFEKRAENYGSPGVFEELGQEIREDYSVPENSDEEKSRLALRDDESWSEYRERLKSIQVERDPEEEKEKEKEAIRVGAKSPGRSSALGKMMQERADDLLGEEGSSDSHPGEETDEMGEIPPEKAQKAAEAFRASDTNLGVWDELADELESGATTEELGSEVDSTTIESIPGGTFMKSDVDGKTTAEIRTTDEAIQNEIREQSHLSLRIVEDRDQDELMVAKSDDFEELQEQIKNL